MIDHIGVPVGDIARATEFYLKALAPLGIAIVMQVSAEESGHGAPARGKQQASRKGRQNRNERAHRPCSLSRIPAG
jgi:hypothetical protein